MNFPGNEIIPQYDPETADAVPLMNKIRSQVEWYEHNFNDSPEGESGWGHHYFCNVDGMPLEFDRSSPKEHRCPLCGRIFSSPEYNDAWLYLYRYDAVMSAYEAAYLFRVTGEKPYLQHAERILVFYAQNYEKFVPHGEASGYGRIMPQMLDEAVFIVRILSTLLLVSREIDRSSLRETGEKLLLPASEFVNGQKNVISNISCWINACVAGSALFTGNEDLLQNALYGPYGFVQQVRQGITEDGFWFEGSMHYDYYTLEAFLHTLLFLKCFGTEIPDDIRDLILKMVIAPARIAFSDTSLPNPNDGWPHIGLKTYAYLYELADFIFDDREIKIIKDRIYHSDFPAAQLPIGGPVTEGNYTLERLIFGKNSMPLKTESPFESCNYTHSDFAMLRGRNIEIFLKYGHRSARHAHPDKMNIEVHAFDETVSYDFSNCGYASSLWSSYYRKSFSHNTVMADGKDQTGTGPGKCVAWDPHGNIRAIAGNVYPGVGFDRELTLLEQGFTDTFRVFSECSHRLEWFFHSEGELLTENIRGEKTTEFQYFGVRGCVRIPAIENKVILNWNFRNMTAKQILSVEPDMQIFAGKCFGMPASHMCSVIMIRTDGNAAEFMQRWEFYPKIR
jgi:hypothetical protein